MSHEVIILLVTTISVAFIHTLAGPDHYLPFIVIAKAKKWPVRKTVLFTIVCGLGHVGSSVILGLVGIFFGIALHKIELWEGVRGSIISYVFTVFGLLYLLWGVKRAVKNKPHRHSHLHCDGVIHAHPCEHSEENDIGSSGKINLAPWVLFTIFVFGPCEPLIPIVMYPAAQNKISVLILVTSVFMVITISTMITLVLLALFGIKIFPFSFLEKYNHAVAGGALFLCGLGMLFLEL